MEGSKIKTTSSLEDEIVEQQDQGTKKKPVHLSIDTDLVSAGLEDWVSSTAEKDGMRRHDESPLYTPSPHSFTGSTHSPPSILRRPSKRLVKPTYDAPTKASRAKKNEKVELPTPVKRRLSGKDRLSRPGTGHGQSPSDLSSWSPYPLSGTTSALFSRPSSAGPCTPPTFGQGGDTHTDDVSELDTIEEQPTKGEIEIHYESLLAEITHLRNDLLEVEKENKEMREIINELEEDGTELGKEVVALRATEGYIEKQETVIDTLQNQLKKVNEKKKEAEGELNVTRNDLERLMKEFDIKRQELDNAKSSMEDLSQERDELSTEVQDLKQQKEDYRRRDLPPDVSAEVVTIADLERNNAEIRQTLKKKDEEMANLQRDILMMQDELKTKERELTETIDYAKQGQDNLDEEREGNRVITERQQNLINTLYTLMDNASQSISKNSDMDPSEIFHLLQNLATEFETRGLHEKVYGLFQAFGKSRRLLHGINEDLKRQLHDMQDHISRLEAAATAPHPEELGMLTPDILSPASPQFPLSPRQSDRDSFEALYRNEVQKHKIVRAKLEQARFEVVKLKEDITCDANKILELETRLKDLQKDYENLMKRVDELQNEGRLWQSEAEEKKSELDMRTSAFEEQARRERRECLEHIKAYYNKTRDETNWHVIDLQEKLSALEEDHSAMKAMFNKVKADKAILEEDIIRRKAFTMDPTFAEHTNAIREKNATRGPLPSLSHPLKADENEYMPPASFVTPTTPTFLLARKQQVRRPIPRYQLPGVKAVHLAKVSEYREKLRQKTAVENDVLAFSTKAHESTKEKGKVSQSSVPPRLPARPNLATPFSPSISIAPPPSPTHPTLTPSLASSPPPPRDQQTAFSTSKFLSPVSPPFPQTQASRFFPGAAAVATTIASSTSIHSSMPISTTIPIYNSNSNNFLNTSTSTLFPNTPSAFPSQEEYKSAVCTEIINKIRKRKMGKLLYPPGRKVYEEVKGKSVWEIWEGKKWVEEDATVREIEILRERGVIE